MGIGALLFGLLFGVGLWLIGTILGHFEEQQRDRENKEFEAAAWRKYYADEAEQKAKWAAWDEEMKNR